MADTPNPEGLRGSIASKVLIYGMITIGVLALASIITAYFKDGGNAADTVKDIFNALLPVIATWVGTVIAFYFGKENFDAANKSVKDLVAIVTSDQKLKGIKANDPSVAIPVGVIKSYSYPGAEEMNVVTLNALLKFMDDNKVLRLPFINSAGEVFYCIHRSIFDKFISIKARSGATVADLTFGDLLTTGGDEIHGYVTSSIMFAKEDATLYDVKLMMDNNKFCEDVFLTKNGLRDEPVIAWITNNKIMESSKV